jgi:hypothetical protein
MVCVFDVGARSGAHLACLGIEDYGWAMEANPKGYNFQVHVTDGREAEATAAQTKKKPNRLGLLLLAMLGYRARPRD